MREASRVPITFLVDKLAAGGAERHALALANGIDRSRFHPSFVALKKGGGLESLLLRDGLQQELCLDVRGGIERDAIRRLAAHFDSCGTRIVVATNPYATFYAAVASRLSRSRPAVLATFHSTILPGLRNQAQMAFYRLVFRFCDVLVYVCENQRLYWRRRGLFARRDVTIHNGIDVVHFAAIEDAATRADVRAAYGFTRDDYLIGICAALRPEKAHGDLLAALARLVIRLPNARCLIIGDGPMRPALERTIDALGLGTRVAITGFQMDVQPFIRACDVMVLPSHSETFSLSALESMALERPMVMTRTGGAAEQVDPGQHGFLFEPGDIEALAHHLGLLADPAERERMGRNASARVRERFTMSAMLSNYENLYLEVAGIPMATRTSPATG